MNIGFLEGNVPGDVLRRAARLGFDGIELGFGWGSPCDLRRWTADDTSRTCDVIAETGVKILSLACYQPTHVSPDPAVREQAAADMARAIEIAPRLGCAVITCLAFGDPAQAPADQVDLFGRVFRAYARQAEDAGVRIGIENWPSIRKVGTIQIGNLAYSPASFEQLFDAVPSTAVGLEFDPSHLFWQGVDPVRALREFADRLVIVHAKDTQVFEDILAWVGMYGDGWYTYRLPGLGDLDWESIARALAEVGYQGSVIIEHEDPIFEGERREEGLSIGLKFLRQVLKQ